MQTPTAPCPAYPAATYGVDPNTLAQTGGGSQLVTVVAPSNTARSATFVAWQKVGACWAPASLPGQPAQPFRAETGYGGLMPLANRVSGDGATPIGLFAFGPSMYGNAPNSPSALYSYVHLTCGSWWDEQPGSPTYESFQQLPCGVTPPYAADSEALWTQTEAYQHFADIMMPHPPDNGAGIFLHDDTTSGYTAGCIALPNGELDAVLGWLNPALNPHILIGAGADIPS